jgi:two-component system NarL family sensor kinase
MPRTALTGASATSLARLIAGREVTAREAVEAHLRRIEAVDAQVNAVVQLDAERALSSADTARYAERMDARITIAVDPAAAGPHDELEVRDDGAGFDPARRAAALQDGHIGLASSERRVRAAGGELVVESAPGRGSTIRATLPRVAGPATVGRPIG